MVALLGEFVSEGWTGLVCHGVALDKWQGANHLANYHSWKRRPTSYKSEGAVRASHGLQHLGECALDLD